LAMRLEIWRSNQKLGLIMSGDEMQSKLRAEMMSGRQAQALRQMSMILTTMIQGVKSHSIHVMKDRCKEFMSSLASRNQALHAMRRFLAHLLHRDMIISIGFWRESLQEHKKMAVDALQESLRHYAQSSSYFLKSIRLCLLRIARGELSLRIHVWRRRARETPQEGLCIIRRFMMALKWLKKDDICQAKFTLDEAVKDLIQQLNIKCYSAEINAIAQYKQSLLAAAFNNLGKSFAMGLLNECAEVINQAVLEGEILVPPTTVPGEKVRPMPAFSSPSQGSTPARIAPPGLNPAPDRDYNP